jgi:hypothetical protein
MPKNPSEKPVLWGNNTTDSAQIHEEDNYAWEHFTPGYTPGYSEVVKVNQLAQSTVLTTAQKEKLYKELRARPRELPMRLKWVRVSGPDGGRSYNANVDLATWRRLGYRPCTIDVLTNAGMKVPPTAHVETDGTIRREDVALWYVDAARARRNEIEQARINADFHSMRPIETGNSEVPVIDVEDHASHRQKTLTEIKDT